ncbi:MAG: molybdopterin-dependent oxidoreductase, partial [Raoultibacter sp.]
MGNNVTGKPIIKGLGFDSFGLGSLACTVDIDEENDKIIRIRPFHFDEKYTPEDLNAWKIEARGKTFEPGFKTLMSPLSLSYKKRVYSKNRIPYPLKREDWDPEGERNPQNRGKSGYVRISWDEAAELAAKEIKRIHDTYGPHSILCEIDGHGETKVVHAAHGCVTKML